MSVFEFFLKMKLRAFDDILETDWIEASGPEVSQFTWQHCKPGTFGGGVISLVSGVFQMFNPLLRESLVESKASGEWTPNK